MNSWSEPAAMPTAPSPTVGAPSTLAQFANAVAVGGQNLLVLRSLGDSLDSISQALQAHWQRHATPLFIEHFSGKHRAALLGHLNATLAHQPLALAMQASPDEPLQHLCMVHDAQSLTPDDLQLLKRMTEQLPGWKTRLVLLYKTHAQSSQTHTAFWGQPSHAWQIWHADDVPPTPAEVSPNSNKLGLAALLALALFGAVVVWQLWPASPTVKRKPALTSPSARDADLSVAPATSTEATPPPASTPPAPQAADASLAALPSPQPQASSAPPAAPLDTRPAPMPELALRGYRWLSGLPKDYFLLLHGSHDNLRAAQRQMDTRPELGTARVIMFKATATEPARFGVVTGPFRSQERAQNFRVRQNLPASSTIEAVGDVLQQSQKPAQSRQD